MKTWKIYKHTNLINGKSYIGQTAQEDLNKRWADGHGYYTKRKNKNNTIFYYAILKYGWENFKHEIIEDGIKTLEEANKREAYWISYYHTFVEDPECWGYNMTAGGSGVSHKCSDSTKQKISKSLTGHIKTKEHQAKINLTLKRKAIICIETGIKYESISEAARQTWISRENIKAAINGKRLSAGNYHWAKIDDQKKIDELKLLAGKCKAAKRKVLCVELGLEFESITAAAKYIGVNQSAISGVLSGKYKTVKNYHWKYLD